MFDIKTKESVWKKIIHASSEVIDCGLPEIGVSGKCPESSQKMGLRPVEHGFSSFFAIFDGFLKVERTEVLWKFEKSSNMEKNEEKPCPSCRKPIF